MNMRVTGSYPAGLTPLVDKRIGDAFPIVEEVYKHLSQLKYLAENSEKFVDKQIEFRANTGLGVIEWRYSDQPEWMVLVSYDELVGVDLSSMEETLNQIIDNGVQTLTDNFIEGMTQYEGNIEAEAEWVPVPSHANDQFDAQAIALTQRTELLKQRADKAVLSYPDYATATAAAAAAATLTDGQEVEVSQDETRAGARTRYKVQEGALVFVPNLDQVRLDLANTTDMGKGAALVGGVARIVASIAELRTLPKTGNKNAIVVGYYAANDGGGGLYYYDAADTTSADNGGNLIVANDGARWKSETISTASFGCRAANTAQDNSNRLIACIAAALAVGQATINVASTFTVDDVAYPIRNKTRVFFKGAQIAGMYRRASLPENPVSNVRTFRQIEGAALAQFSAVKSPVVVMMGDSISGYSVSGATPPDSMWGSLCAEISRKNPSANINFVNRSIGGAVLANANGIGNAFPAWYTNTSTPWLNYVQALNPDLLFLAFGMNDSAGFDAASFHAVMTKIKAWNKVPSIVFVTPPQPSMATTYGGGSGFYDYDAQEGRDYVAGYIRSYAAREGYGLMDINRQVNLLRDGRDILNCPQGLKVTTSGAYALASRPCHEYYFNGGVASWPDGGILQASTGPSTGDWVRIVKSGTALTITANTSGAGIYKTINYTLPNATLQSISISVSATTCVIALDAESEISRFNLLKHGGEFRPRLSWSTNPTAGPFDTYILSLGSPLLVAQTLTDDMIYGAPNASAGENTPFGGNGVNHYSAEGVARIVRPVVESLNLEQRVVAMHSDIIAPDGSGIVVQKPLRAYREGNIVHISGSASVTSSAVDKLIFTLPEGFRPSTQILQAAVKLFSNVWSPCILRITATGEVRLYDVATAASVEMNISFVIA